MNDKEFLEKFIKKYCRITERDSEIHFSHFCSVFYKTLSLEEKKKWNSQRIKDSLPYNVWVEGGWLKGIH